MNFPDTFAVRHAIEAQLADMDSFTEWLGGACIYRHNVCSEKALRIESRLAESDTATIMHAALSCAAAGDDGTAGKALRLLREKYLASHASQIVVAASDIEHALRDDVSKPLHDSTGREWVTL